MNSIEALTSDSYNCKIHVTGFNREAFLDNLKMIVKKIEAGELEGEGDDGGIDVEEFVISIRKARVKHTNSVVLDLVKRGYFVHPTSTEDMYYLHSYKEDRKISVDKDGKITELGRL
jgi:hypothetical protein